MIIDSIYIELLALSFFSCTSTYLAIWYAENRRIKNIVGYLALGCLVGFMSFMLLLLIKTKFQTGYTFDVIACFVYSLFIRNAKIFHSLKY